MEPHVKERIVGAAILVALGVWLIPWVLDGPNETTEATEAASDEILPAAAETTPVRSETVELDPSPVASRRAREPDAAGAVEPARDEESFAVAEPAESDATSVDADDAAAAVGEAAAGGQAADGEAVAAVSAADRAEAPSERPASAAAAPDRSATGRDGWAVQLGAFGDVANADQLASRISTYGYTAYVAEFRSGGETMHRVRVGGFASEREAEAAAGSLSAHGFPGRVIAPE